jgi:ribokinase
LRVPRIAVVGSYATGLTMKVSRIPGPGETLLGTGYRVDFGGKGSNQAVGCARLGAQVDFIARIGNDSFGDMALTLYREEGIDTTHINRSSGAPTGVGFIVVEECSGQNSIVIDPGANELLTASDVAEDQDVLKSAAVVLTPLAGAGAAGAITILNPAPVRVLSTSVLSLVDILTPNESEAKILAGHAPDATVDAEAAGRELIRRGVKQVVMTLGENGALLINASSCTHFPAVQVRAVDTTGAGDAFNAGLATALAHAAPIEQAVQFAVVIGAMAVTKEGVIPSLPRYREVLEFYELHSLPAPTWLAKHPAQIA